MIPRLVALSCVALVAACAGPALPPPPPPPAAAMSSDAASRAIAIVLDDFHAAAASADEARYFGHFAEEGVFLGTDATERWTVPAFRAYAHPHFEKGKAWAFKAARRAVEVDAAGTVAWFDEDLVTPNLGPARGSGVLVLRAGSWKIAQYNLAIVIPNDRFKDVKALLDARN